MVRGECRSEKSPRVGFLRRSFVDGLGMGTNTKAAIMRLGLLDMIRFCAEFYGGGSSPSTFYESCGIADLITTCFGGRNRKVGNIVAFVGPATHVLAMPVISPSTRRLALPPPHSMQVAEAFVRTRKGWAELEAELLGGQKLQGTLTAAELRIVLDRAEASARDPLFMTVARIVAGELPPQAIIELQLHVPAQEHRRGHAQRHE